MGVGQAVAFGDMSVTLADRSADVFIRIVNRAMLADALHQAGRWEESMEAFRKAEALQAEWQPTDTRLYSLLGYQHCDLLGLGEPESRAGLAGPAATPEEVRRFRQECREVQDRAGQRLKWAIQQHFLHDIARDYLSLGRAHLSLALTALWPAAPGEEAEVDFAEAAQHLDRAVKVLRQAGQELYLPRGLLARATLHRLRGDRAGAATDLSEALEIAERGGMRLHACDAHLGWTRLYLQQGDAAAARRHVAVARQLVNETGYRRREREVVWLERRLGVTGTPPS
jgi:tetratricopeptide (TPR) repeat protein